MVEVDFFEGVHELCDGAVLFVLAIAITINFHNDIINIKTLFNLYTRCAHTVHLIHPFGA